MREFQGTASAELMAEVRRRAQELFDLVPEKREVRGAALVMDDEDALVLREAVVPVPDMGKLQISATEATARPPFEWLLEITSDLHPESDYFHHYLVREHDTVLAIRKDLTVIDEEEARLILADLATARAVVATLGAGEISAAV